MAKTCAGVDTNIIECGGSGDAGIWVITTWIINIFSILVGIAAVIGIVIFGIQILTSKGDPARVTKAKKRLSQIIIGLTSYIVLWAGVQWLLPGGLFKAPSDIESIIIYFQTKTAYVGDTIAPKVAIFPQNAIDRSFTLSSENKSIVAVRSNTIYCKKAGTATITATTSNEKTDSTTIKCINKPKRKSRPKKNDSDDGNDNGGGGEMPDGDYYTTSQIEQFNQEWNSLGNITYDEVKQLAQNMGISDKNLAGILAWAHFESYEYSDRYGPYFAYLCNSVGVNSALSYESRGDGSGWLNQIIGWGGGYTNAEYVGTHENTGGYASGYLPLNLKSVYMALKHTYPNIYGCSGNTSNGGGYVPGSHNPVYDPVGANGTGGDSLIFDGQAP